MDDIPRQTKDIHMESIVAGSCITKESRHEQFGVVAGGSGSRGPEIYQRKMIVEGTRIPCEKTLMRINLETNTLHKIAHPNTRDDGFEFTEDFDGVQIVGPRTIYVNLKCVVGKGGSQTRSLREVYAFVRGQLNYLVSDQTKNTYFANILDGDEAHAVMGKFAYMIGKRHYENVKDRIYVGDLKGYFGWFQTVNVG